MMWKGRKLVEKKEQKRGGGDNYMRKIRLKMFKEPGVGKIII